MIKILDKYLIRTFIPPMIMATVIAVFVLVMQRLWLYIDEIMGKGVSFWEISQMLSYMSVSFLPLGLPIGILISSVMLFGNLGEKYELAGIKSAGVSLFRTMLPLIVACVGLGLFSFYCSNNLIPYTNLKFMTQLYDIRKQKPALNLQEGVYNYDFDGYAIKIGSKGANGQNLKDVFIYDHSQARRNVVSVITADSGRMYTTPNEKYLIMELHNGFQYQEMADNYAQKTYPVMRTQFKTYTKVFDLSQFAFSKTNDEVFKKHENMLNVSQLSNMVDSLESMLLKVKTENVAGMEIRRDTSEVQQQRVNPIAQNKELLLDSFSTSSDFLHRFKEKYRSMIVSKAVGSMNFYVTNAQNLEYTIQHGTEKISKYKYQKHNKYALAVVCVIFLFIGAPMGAIVRKGGFGYPMLVAIVFFMIFLVITLFSETMVDKAKLNALLGAWLGCLILFPIGVFLTYKASKDSKFINLDAIQAFFKRIFGKAEETT